MNIFITYFHLKPIIISHFLLFLRNMKRLALLIIISLVCGSLEAKVVTRDQAKKVADCVLADKSGRDIAYKYVSSTDISSKEQSGAPAFHIFNRDGQGFVIVAGDDCVAPVIGYSETGSFVTENMPANVAEWLEMWSCIINAMRADGYTPGKDVEKEWKAFESGALPTKDGNEKVLETAKWDQGRPYNLLCPDFLGRGESTRCVTGCTATALAIIMRYHMWPDCGVGKLDTYSFRDDNGKTRTVQGFNLGHKYDWANMPLKYTGRESDAQNDAVARLMYDIGVMLQSMYNPGSTGGTGAYLEDVAPGAIKHFKFDKSASCKYYSSYKSTWLQMIKDNIDNVGPVDYAAHDTKNGGHSFVIDGYRGDEVHINWGWSGQNDGFFTIPNFNPSSYKFTEGHSAVFNLMKDQSDMPYSIEYNTESNILSIKSKNSLSVTVKDSRGAEVKDGITSTDKETTIDTGKLTQDSYSVSITAAKETASLTIKMGLK